MIVKRYWKDKNNKVKITEKEYDNFDKALAYGKKYASGRFIKFEIIDNVGKTIYTYSVDGKVVDCRNESKLNTESKQDITDEELQEQIAKVEQDWINIKDIKDPPEEVQIRAIRKHKWALAIGYISNPTERIQLIAVNQYGRSLRLIKNPSLAVQLAAVRKDGTAIQFVDNPSEELQLEAVKQNGGAIKYLNSPSQAVQLAAVRQKGYVIVAIENPSEKVQIAAVTQDEYAIYSIDNPSEKVKAAWEKAFNKNFDNSFTY